jgi:hypothetical protein
MTLKQKFLKLYHSFTISDEWEGSLESDAEQIADEFAIGFAEWLNIQYRELNHTLAFREKTLTEILQIYKKEKGL